MAASTISQSMKDAQPEETPSRYLLVVGPNLTATYKLPDEGTLLIGRDESAPLRLLDPQASRNHARLYLGKQVELEDLGSANGTRLREQEMPAFQRVTLLPCDSFMIGDTVLLLQARGSATKPRKLWSHAHFEIRLIEECARAQRAQGAFAVARLHVSAAPEKVTDVVVDKLRPGDLLAAYGPNEYELLLPDSAAPQVEALIDRVRNALVAVGLPVQCGLAIYPIDGSSPQELVSRACAKVLGTPVPPGSGAAVVRNQAMQQLYAMAQRAAAGPINVLILGETGAGKEVLAQSIHQSSPRAGKALMTINCASLSETLLESELFGHEKGAFSGAVGKRVGLLEAANGGTVFLDEVGEMTPGLQAKLLRAIDAKEVRPVGGNQTRPIDVRFIAATNRDLVEEVAEKRFREDLYFRLNGICLELPPLRDRSDEIEPLARMFLENFARLMGRAIPRIEDEALSLMRAYGWPGNIRELRNVMERALVLCAGDTIAAEHLPADKMSVVSGASGGEGLRAVGPPQVVLGGAEALEGHSWRERVALGQRKAIQDALERCSGNQTRAAELLGMPRRTFCVRMKEFGIPGPRPRG